MNRFFLEFWNPDTDEMEWREFFPEEVDELMEREMIDVDMLSGAMTDQNAFDEALIRETKKGGIYSYSDFVKTYLSLTDKDIRIRP